MNNAQLQGHIRLSSNLIGIPEIIEPVDNDMAIIVGKSQGQMMIPCLLIQLLREVRHVKERLNQLTAVNSAVEQSSEAEQPANT